MDLEDFVRLSEDDAIYSGFTVTTASNTDGKILYRQTKIRRSIVPQANPLSRLAVQHQQLLPQGEYFGLAEGAGRRHRAQRK